MSVESPIHPEIRINPQEILAKTDSRLQQLKEVGQIEKPPVILSGSAVFLYQLAFGSDSVNRIPTDLDVVVCEEDFSKILEKAEDLGLILKSEPRITKWGVSYHNFLLEGEGDFPVDVMRRLNTYFPESANFFPQELYTFPDFFEFPQLLRVLQINGNQYYLASPTYILFYKLTQMRQGASDNGTIKDDRQDIQRIFALGVVTPEELNSELNILCYGDNKLRRMMIESLSKLAGQSIPFIELPPEELPFEDQIQRLITLTPQLDQIFGEGNWCFSNGTALGIYSFLGGKRRPITDIDVFYLGKGNIGDIFPQSFFNKPFGRLKYDPNEVSAHGILYCEPQLRGTIYLNGIPFNVDIINRSRMKKRNGELTITPEKVREGLVVINGIPLMHPKLIEQIKKFSNRKPPKTDPEDLNLIRELLSSSL